VGGDSQYPDDVCRIDQCFYCKEQPGGLEEYSDAENILVFHGSDCAEQFNRADGGTFF
jgi:hypothetical protein